MKGAIEESHWVKHSKKGKSYKFRLWGWGKETRKQISRAPSRLLLLGSLLSLPNCKHRIESHRLRTLLKTKTTPQLQQKVMPKRQRKAKAKSVLITTLSINIDEQLGTKKINISSTEKTSNIKWLNSWVHPPPRSYVEWKCHFIFDWHPNLT